MKLVELMSSELVCVELDDSLAVIKKRFEETGFHHLLVLEDKQLFGIISDRDLLRALSPFVDSESATTKDLACLNKKAHQIMTRKPICINHNGLIKEAVAIFNQHKISCIPVVDDSQVPVGVLSWRDIMRALAKVKAS